MAVARNVWVLGDLLAVATLKESGPHLGYICFGNIHIRLLQHAECGAAFEDCLEVQNTTARTVIRLVSRNK